MIFEPLLFKGYVRFPGSDSGKALLFDNNNSSSNNKDKGVIVFLIPGLHIM